MIAARRAGAWRIPSGRHTRAEVVAAVRPLARELGIEADELVSRDGSDWVVPRGLALPARATDGTVRPISGLLAHRVNARDYQRRAVARAAKAGGGVLVAPCGSGKTTMGVDLICRAPTPALVLVHTRDLVNQWTERLRRDVARVKIGSVTDARPRVAVETIQRLAAMSPAELRAVGAKFGLIVVDEAHHVPADTWSRVLTHLPAAHRYGLTATPERLDARHPMLHAHLGPVVAEVGHAEVEKAGAVIRPEVRFVLTRSSGARHEDASRDAAIARVVRAEIAQGRRVLVLVQRIEHAEALAALTSTRGGRVVALTSRVAPVERAKAMAELRAGSVRALVATTLADEGLDLPELETVVLATPTSSLGRVVQRVGRVLRPGPRKVARVYDLVDEDAQEQALEREALYASRGWKVVVSRRTP